MASSARSTFAVAHRTRTHLQKLGDRPSDHSSELGKRHLRISVAQRDSLVPGGIPRPLWQLIRLHGSQTNSKTNHNPDDELISPIKQAYRPVDVLQEGNLRPKNIGAA